MTSFSGKVLTLAIFVCIFVAKGYAKDDRPNLIFVLADDYGYNDIGYHGKQIKTPKLNKVAKSGVILENYYVQPVCVPTRSQLLSGRYQIHTGLQHGNVPHLPLDSLTLADQLKKVGYRTHMMGKWHLGYPKNAYMPQYRGFETYLGYLSGHEKYFNHTHPYKGVQYLDWRDEKGPRFQDQGTYSTNLLTDSAIRKIREHDQSKGPLFIYLAYQAVHDPLEAPDKYIKKYRHIKKWNRRTYAGMVAAMDDGFGNLTDALKETGMWKNTVLVFSTDNGGNPHAGGNNMPLRGKKGSLWEGGMRGVGFVAGGRVGPKGVVNREMIHVSDWFPTFVNLAKGGYNGTKPLDGYDQWKTINGKAPSPRNTILHNIDIAHPALGKPVWKYRKVWNTTVRASIRVKDLKLITGDPGDGRWFPVPGSDSRPTVAEDKKKKNLWLFNITADPNEKEDISKQRPQEVMYLMQKLVEFNRTAVPPLFNHHDPRHNPAKTGGVWGPWENQNAFSSLFSGDKRDDIEMLTEEKDMIRRKTPARTKQKQNIRSREDGY